MRLARFALSFALGLFLVTLLSFLLLMAQVAPGRSTVPFMGVAIDPGSAAPIVYLPNPLFQCTPQNQQSRCEATLNRQPLQVTIVQTPDSLEQSEICRAAYAGKPIDCQSGGSFYIGRGWLQFYFLNSNLGLTAAQLQDLQRQYWLTNWLGMNAEEKLSSITLGFAGAGAVLAIGLNGLNDNRLTRILTSLSSGYILALSVWGVLILTPATNPTQYGMNGADWQNVGLPIALIAAGTAGTILTGFYLRRRPNGAINVIVSLLMGYAIAIVVWIATMLGFSLLVSSGGWLVGVLSPLIGVVTVVLLAGTARSLKAFSCGVSALGAFLLVLTLLQNLLNLRIQDY